MFLFVFSMISSTVLAVPLYFNDRQAFNNALTSTLNFEGFETNFTTADSISFGDFTFSETGGANFVGNAMNYSSGAAGITEGFGALYFADNGPSIGNFQFTMTTPINAMGFDMTVLLPRRSSTTTTITVGGDLNTTFSLADDIPGFFGVIDYDNMFDTVTLNASGMPGIVFDAMEYGFSGNQVPEPDTLLLLGAGLVGLIALRRKGSHKS